MMKWDVLLLLTVVLVMLATGCPNLGRLAGGGQGGGSHVSSRNDGGDTTGDGFSGDRDIPVVAPVDFTEEVILVKLTENQDRPQWTEKDLLKNVSTKLEPNVVGFGKLEEDLDKDGHYAISLPKPLEDRWLHVSIGTVVDGKLEEGILMDSLGNRHRVTNLWFSFSRRDPPSMIFEYKITRLEVESQVHYAKAQIVDSSRVRVGESVRILPYDMVDNHLQLQLHIEADIQDDKTGYKRTLMHKVYCGVKNKDVASRSFSGMFAGY